MDKEKQETHLIQSSSQDSLFYSLVKDLEKFPSLFLYMVISMRGLGKSYGALKYFIEEKRRFIYCRRTAAELENCCTPANNPFKRLNKDLGWTIKLVRAGEIFIITDDEKNEYGLACALSTLGNVRSADYIDIEYILIDEFINTRKINYLKPADEIDAFANLIESVLRNDEVLYGRSLQIILFSNANSLESGIIEYLELADIIRKMKRDKEEYYVNEDRGLMVHLPTGKELKEKKKNTKLYKLMKGTKFYDMALNNEFVTENFDIVRKIPYQKLVPLCSYESAYFYNVKDEDIIYVTKRKHNVNNFTEESRRKFEKSFLMTIQYYYDENRLFISNYNVKLILDKIIKK